MSAYSSSSIRRTFRISIDIEASIDSGSQGERQAFLTWLSSHPRVLHQFLRSVAVDELKLARTLLENEYGWGKVSDQQLFQEAFAELGPATQAYFSEELEDGAVVYTFDDYRAAIKQFQIEELG